MTTQDARPAHVSDAQLRVMPLHAVTEVYGEPGLQRRLTLELDQLPRPHRDTVADAAAWATQVHAPQRRAREPYINHPLRVTLRILHHYRITDPDLLVAALLHDTVEDQPWAIAGVAVHGPPPTDHALTAITARYNRRVAGLVAAVTAPPCPAGADRIRHYTLHLIQALDANPHARVIKLSDFTDNGVGIIHSSGPVVIRSARKYRPAVPLLRDFLDRPDTPLHDDVRTHIHHQLDLAQQRFTAILAA